MWMVVIWIIVGITCLLLWIGIIIHACHNTNNNTTEDTGPEDLSPNITQKSLDRKLEDIYERINTIDSNLKDIERKLNLYL